MSNDGQGFWQQIDRALAYIDDGEPETFDDVKLILDVWGDPDGVGTHTPDVSFFAGSGGDRQLLDALDEAGWKTLWCKATYHFAVQHPRTLETLTYVEGDVYRGDRGHL
jgi:hypothetical protein